MHVAASSNMIICFWLNAFLFCPFSDVIGDNTITIVKISHAQVDNNVAYTQKGTKSNNHFARINKIYLLLNTQSAYLYH